MMVSLKLVRNQFRAEVGAIGINQITSEEYEMVIREERNNLNDGYECPNPTKISFDEPSKADVEIYDVNSIEENVYEALKIRPKSAPTADTPLNKSFLYQVDSNIYADLKF